MLTINEIINKYRQINDEEQQFLEYKKLHNENVFTSDKSQIMDAKELIKSGNIILKKHPRFCHTSIHKHNYLEVNYILSGEVKEIIDGKEVYLEKGEVVFLNKNSNHEIFPCEENDILINFIILPEFFDILFPFMDKDGLIKRFLTDLLSNNNENNSIIFHSANCLQVQNIIMNILACFEEKDDYFENVLQQYFLLLIYELANHVENAEETKQSNYESVLLVKTYNYIESNYASASLFDLSEMLGESYDYISKKIKKISGKTFKNLVEEQRIKVAKTLLKNTKINIDDIAYHIGYNNLTFFYKLFRNNVGMTPLEYRNSSIS